ncbi:hypothetical protein HPB50_029607 [Hyalomma asiaticum]|nr:hypothetical protein HPB50_029607 [Hyalomma asiaticum]
MVSGRWYLKVNVVKLVCLLSYLVLKEKGRQLRRSRQYPRGSAEPFYEQQTRPAPTAKTGPKKAPAAKSNKPEPKKTHTGHSPNVKPGTPSEPPVRVKSFPPLNTRPSTGIRSQAGRVIRASAEAEADDGDDGSSVTSRLTSVSRQDADMVVGPASITGPIGRLESLECKTEQLEARVAAFPTQIMSAVLETFQDTFTAALTQALPDIVAQVSNSVLKAVQPWVSTQIKNTTQRDSPQLKRKPASRQAAEGFSEPAPGGPVRLLTAAAPTPGPDRSPAP